jgi:hypothetical protein
VKWVSVGWQLIRDIGLTGFGVWVIWTQVYQPAPSAALLVVALGCIAPAARAAAISVLSGPGSSSQSPAPQEEPPSPPSQQEEGADGRRG